MLTVDIQRSLPDAALTLSYSLYRGEAPNTNAGGTSEYAAVQVMSGTVSCMEQKPDGLSLGMIPSDFYSRDDLCQIRERGKACVTPDGANLHLVFSSQDLWKGLHQTWENVGYPNGTPIRESILALEQLLQN